MPKKRTKKFELKNKATKYALTSINKDAPVKPYLNSEGLAAGLIIKL